MAPLTLALALTHRIEFYTSKAPQTSPSGGDARDREENDISSQDDRRNADDQDLAETWSMLPTKSLQNKNKRLLSDHGSDPGDAIQERGPLCLTLET